MNRHEAVSSELDRLEVFFRRLDEAYGEALFLEQVLATLPEEKRGRYFNRADGIVGIMLREQGGDGPSEVLCPLYTGEGCGLYEFRPLICRLHGIPYDYAPPGRPAGRGAGCHRFEEEIDPLGKPYEPFDRTSWFGEMAAIEIAIRRRLGYGDRIRRTVAEMIVEIRNASGRAGKPG